ncbi:eukaryotic type KH-domain (KH-domain type I) [Xylariaceae sp. FL1272]|nr:eukaryotic type KH-domain (KH-domain type I) [Xylariaceae sp. FL1272]
MASHRISRWAHNTTLQLPTAIAAPMTSEQLDAYVTHVRIEELTQKLHMKDFATANRLRRSPSPEPTYDASGRRTNTRQQRQRQRLEDERHILIQTAMKSIPNYCVPAGYVPQAPTREKIYIPVKDFPEINFIGQLLGPRGRSLAQLNERSGTNIVIRGRGSVKEGKRGRRHDTNRTGDEHEPLHCLITADMHEKLDTAKELLQDVIETIIAAPEANDRKRQQLRDLAVVNGTFRDDEGRNEGHEVAGIAAHIRCHFCGGGGHIARDCSDRRTCHSSSSVPPWRMNEKKHAQDILETEYQQLISDIGV